MQSGAQNDKKRIEIDNAPGGHVQGENFTGSGSQKTKEKDKENRH